ncbi:ABC transporter substrate-binding protein [Microlunatus sp. GCM10028923]|uniref:ABC transporter substrate-binding protein n=1 Tax=Microlunatus sp. GCM10028923 TaxID=3273400 RepID=UPI003618E874
MTRLLAVCAAAALLLCAACTEAGSDGGKITITLAGPNQWNNDPKSFGPEWEDLVQRFEAQEPSINVETTVLPLKEFAQTLSTQLAAGTAPELVFSQAPHKPEQVHALNAYLEQPNPYVKGNQRWIDLFNQDYFGANATAGRNAADDYEFIPFNLVIIGVFYNQDLMQEAGVTAPIRSYGELIDACGKIKAAGHIPFAMDGGRLGQGWTQRVISSMMAAKYAEQWNQFDAEGNPGKADQVTAKSLAKAVLTGELDPTTTPEIAEGLNLFKKFFDECATPNWSGIGGGAAFTGGEDFTGGRAAMAWGTNFAVGNLADVSWKWGTMAFPTITEADSPLASGAPAQFGAQVGGTNYMIPSTVEGQQLEAAVKFLQFASSPTHGQKWLDASGGIPATKDADPAPGLDELMSGEWFKAPVVQGTGFVPKAESTKNIYDGFLLNNQPLDAQLAEMKEDWIAWAKESAKENNWTEDWAKG